MDNLSLFPIFIFLVIQLFYFLERYDLWGLEIIKTMYDTLLNYVHLRSFIMVF